MASAYETLFGSGNNTTNELDLIDIIAVIVLPAMAGFVFQVFTMTVNVFGGFDFSASLWTVSGIDISAAFLISLFAAVWIIATNLANVKTDVGKYQYAIIVIAILLPVAYVIIPSVESLIMSSDWLQLVAWLYVSIAGVATSYLG